MNQQDYQQPDPKTIETLKAARDQVIQVDKGGGANINVTTNEGQNPSPKHTPGQILTDAVNHPEVEDKQKSTTVSSIGAAQRYSKGPVEILMTEQVHNKFTPLETYNKEPKGQQLSKNITDKFLTGFASEFIQKLTSIEQEKAAVDEEMTRVEKLWSSLVEKKKQLEGRKNELTKVKDRLKELDKEMSNVLKSQ